MEIVVKRTNMEKTKVQAGSAIEYSGLYLQGQTLNSLSPLAVVRFWGKLELGLASEAKHRCVHLEETAQGLRDTWQLRLGRTAYGLGFGIWAHQMIADAIITPMFCRRSPTACI